MSEYHVGPWRGVIRKYRDFLPVGEERWIVTLNEGWTPLIRTKRMQEVLPGNIEVYLKYEGLNPTGSFKDRGMTVAVSKVSVAMTWYSKVSFWSTDWFDTVRTGSELFTVKL